MKKLALKLEELSVETFGVDGAAGDRGTVNGNIGPYPQTFNVNPDCSAGCTDYCETDGGGAGYTCDFRCQTRNYPGCLSANGPSCVAAYC